MPLHLPDMSAHITVDGVVWFLGEDVRRPLAIVS
jgi:hypothetical protein